MSAYLLQFDAIQMIDSRVVLMASRELCRIASGPDEYNDVYTRVLSA